MTTNLKKHSFFSASSSHRWLLCSASAKLEKNLASVDTEFSKEGTLAHDLAQKFLLSPPENRIYDLKNEMHIAIKSYVDYIENIENYNSCNVFIEKIVSFSNVVDDGFGTVDCILIDIINNILHIIDLKYGKGIKVNSFNNSQLILYALGAINTFKLVNIKKIKLHIVQPRIDNFSFFELTIEELIEKGKEFSAKAKLCLVENPKFNPGEIQCKFCKVKNNCPSLTNFIKNDLLKNFENLENSNLNDKIKIYDNKNLILDFLNTIENELFTYIQNGNKIAGYTIGFGKTMRVWKSDANIKLKEILNENDIYNKKLKSITEIEKLLTKKEFEKLDLTIKSTPTLKLLKEKEDQSKNLIDLFDKEKN